LEVVSRVKNFHLNSGTQRICDQRIFLFVASCTFEPCRSKLPKNLMEKSKLNASKMPKLHSVCFNEKFQSRRPSLCLSLLLSRHQSLHLSFHVSSVYPSICPSVFPSFCPSFYPFFERPLLREHHRGESF
jgi:hypothetical protein